MNVWAFLAVIAMLSGAAYLAVVFAASSGVLSPGRWAWFRSAVAGESDAVWRTTHRAARPAAVVGGAGAIVVAALGGFLHGWTPPSAPWTFAALVLLGGGLFVGSMLANRAATGFAVSAA